MTEVDLHVFIEPILSGSARAQPSDPAVRHVGVGHSTMGLRAKMVYVHGDVKNLQDPRVGGWFKTSVLTRLIDDNPARVVYNNA